VYQIVKKDCIRFGRQIHQMEEKECIIFGSKKRKMQWTKKVECIRLVRKKYNRLARRNGEHHIEMIKYFEWGKRNVSIWGKNYVTGGRRNPKDLKKLA
jgi:hypothetical protein